MSYNIADFYLPDGTKTVPPYDVFNHVFDPDEDGYTSKPTHVRIFDEDTGDEQTWHIDGVDANGRYTEAIERYATEAEALAVLPRFVAENFEGKGK